MNKHGGFLKLPFPARNIFFLAAWLLVLPVFCLLLLSCSHGPSHGPKTERTVLRFSFWGAGPELVEMKTLIADYEASHPSIDIEPLHVPDNYFQKLHILAAGDLTPDVMMLNSLYLPVYADNNILLPLSVTTAGSKNGFASKIDTTPYYPQTLKALSWHQTLYALPRDVSNMVVFYNADLLRAKGLALPEANWSMARFIATAKAVCEPPSKQHPAGVFGVTFFEKPLYWLPWVWSYGGTLFNEDFTASLLNRPESLAGLSAYRDLIWTHHVAPNKRQVGMQAMSQLFADGHIAFFISGRWSVPYLRDAARFQWDVAPFPRGPHGSVVGIDASGYAVARASKSPDAARDFVVYLTSAKALKRLTASGLIVPARQDLAEQAVFLKQPGLPKQNRVFIDVIATGEPTHTPKRWDEVSEELGLGLEPVWDGRSSAQAAVPDLNTRVEALLKD